MNALKKDPIENSLDLIRDYAEANARLDLLNRLIRQLQAERASLVRLVQTMDKQWRVEKNEEGERSTSE